MRQISRKEYGAAGTTERYGNVLSLGCPEHRKLRVGSCVRERRDCGHNRK